MTYVAVDVDFDHRAELVLGFSTVKFFFQFSTLWNEVIMHSSS